jgi:hypothetical protein
VDRVLADIGHMENRAAKMDIDDLLKYVTKRAYFFEVVLMICFDRPTDFCLHFMTLESTFHDAGELFSRSNLHIHDIVLDHPTPLSS